MRAAWSCNTHALSPGLQGRVFGAPKTNEKERPVRAQDKNKNALAGLRGGAALFNQRSSSLLLLSFSSSPCVYVLGEGSLTLFGRVLAGLRLTAKLLRSAVVRAVSSLARGRALRGELGRQSLTPGAAAPQARLWKLAKVCCVGAARQQHIRHEQGGNTPGRDQRRNLDGASASP